MNDKRSPHSLILPHQSCVFIVCFVVSCACNVRLCLCVLFYDPKNVIISNLIPGNLLISEKFSPNIHNLFFGINQHLFWQVKSETSADDVVVNIPITTLYSMYQKRAYRYIA